MPCIFGRTEEHLTEEHVFPAFMGGDLAARNGSCETCNGKFGKDEGVLKVATTPFDRDAVDQQWYPIISAFCGERGIIGIELVERS